MGVEEAVSLGSASQPPEESKIGAATKTSGGSNNIGGCPFCRNHHYCVLSSLLRSLCVPCPFPWLVCRPVRFSDALHKWRRGGTGRDSTWPFCAVRIDS